MYARVWQTTFFVRIWFNNIETVGSRKGGSTRQRGGGEVLNYGKMSHSIYLRYNVYKHKKFKQI